ncbi:hypothetical protein [Actinoplanes sp. NPDC051494]|uniref:hypothetical protein n=1 Tax=Actinoplanes sp. NPDC051494 TaxID=3363907 RepID=UPI0037BB85FC
MLRSGRTALLLCALLTAGCTSESTPAPAPSVDAVTTPPAAPSVSATPVVQVSPPATVEGELVREVYAAGKSGTSFEGQAREGVLYRLEVACAATNPDVVLEYAVRSARTGASGDALLSGNFSCDGGRDGVDGLTMLPAGQIDIDITGDRSEVTSLYAVIIPDTGGGN